MSMKSIAEIGLKIAARTREYYHYTGVSAELERRGAGSSRPHLAWAVRSTQPREKIFAEFGPEGRSSPTNHS
jgi:hypothetical protein